MKKYAFLLALLSATLTGMAQKKPVLNHIALSVYDLGKATAFYRDIMHIDTIPEPFHDGKHTWFRISEQSQLHLIQNAKAITQHDKNSHICFSVPSVEGLIDLLDKHQIYYENWAGEPKTVTKRVDGVKQIYLKDPDGYWIEINDDKY
ncbi:VOC family protein [Chitinophaga sedimenti]|uniref:VOC family protein n=1 Tax=Chitinophaga sedimenti TaxID=2033606 RepID=UPI0020032065|nr:VOC family protein [Chitinophaga sedimenti]MCK7557519.1 VOC family protein [Chitinophaga sedimenti]